MTGRKPGTPKEDALATDDTDEHGFLIPRCWGTEGACSPQHGTGTPICEFEVELADKVVGAPGRVNRAIRTLVLWDDPDAGGFVRSRSEHGIQPAGWTRLEGDGRVCVLTPGHPLAAWLHPRFQNLLREALQWAGQL